MEMTQVYELMNDITSQYLGEEMVLEEDLSNVVDVGTALFDATSVDNYVRTLVDRVGRVLFVSRPYSGSVPSVLMDAWEFGAVTQKISADLPEASENESWELEDGKEYSPNIFYKPSVSNKFFSKNVTFEIPMSFTERQVKSAFNSATELNAFISMLYNAVDKSLTVKIDGLIMRTINNMIGITMNDNNSNRAINLLEKYNDAFGLTLTAKEAMLDREFIRFASLQMSLTVSRLGRLSKLFNIDGKDRFTSGDFLKTVLLNDFKMSADSYMMADIENGNFVSLPSADIVPYWQGSGTEYSFDSVSSIRVVLADGSTVSTDGILGVMFDKDALGVTNLDRRVTTAYNPKAEFYNNFYKVDCGAFSDTQENFVVFYIQDV
jgi:hypothetical protein